MSREVVMVLIVPSGIETPYSPSQLLGLIVLIVPSGIETLSLAQ